MTDSHSCDIGSSEPVSVFHLVNCVVVPIDEISENVSPYTYPLVKRGVECTAEECTCVRSAGRHDCCLLVDP